MEDLIYCIDACFQTDVLVLGAGSFALNEYEAVNLTRIRITAIQKFGPTAALQLALISVASGTNPKRIRTKKIQERKRVTVTRTVKDYFDDGSIKLPKNVRGDPNAITLARLTQAFALEISLIFFCIRREKIVECPLPGYLQFPGAASLPLKREVKEMMLEFNEKFSIQIGGKFNKGLVDSALSNPIKISENSFVSRAMGRFSDHINFPDALSILEQGDAELLRERLFERYNLIKNQRSIPALSQQELQVIRGYANPASNANEANLPVNIEATIYEQEPQIVGEDNPEEEEEDVEDQEGEDGGEQLQEVAV